MTSEERVAEVRYTASHGIIAASVVGTAGSALIAWIFGSFWVAALIACAWWLGMIAGLHIQGIRESIWRSANPPSVWAAPEQEGTQAL